MFDDSVVVVAVIVVGADAVVVNGALSAASAPLVVGILMNEARQGSNSLEQ